MLAAVAFEAVTEDMNAAKMKDRMLQMALGNEKQRIAPQIKVLLEGTNPRHKNMFVPLDSMDSTGPLTVELLYILNIGTKNSKLGSN